MSLRSVITAAALTLSLSSMAMAQHANFVLFGSDKPGKDAPKEHNFVAPVSCPYYHEDSFVTTDVRAWFAYHDLPSGGLLDGGTAKVYAAQIRVALTDQLQLVAYKDGWMDIDSGAVDDSGNNDIAAGLKWNFVQDWENQFHAAVGVGYELPLGDPSVLQNDDEIRVWASVNKGYDKLHLGATLNGIFKVGGQDALGDQNRIIANLHADYYMCEWFSPVVEVNAVIPWDRGTRALPFSGSDVFNLGGGDTVITGALGFEARPIDKLGIRAAYELPIDRPHNDLWGSRLTISVIYSF